jgi:exopolyphosphatase / guanosine-5'-triphosphate,3'-diphosphate pyrophosphatase
MSFAADDGGTVVGSRSIVTRLGAGLARSGRLDPAAIERLGHALRTFREAHPDITEWHALATAAVREAANGAEAIAVVNATLGASPTVLSGLDEGRYAFAGAVAGLPPHSGATLVIDIGGASTEFTIGSTEAEHAISVPLGALRLTEAELDSDPPKPEELSNAVGFVSDHMDDVLRELPGVRQADRVIMLGGSVNTVASVEIGLTVYDRSRTHGFVLSREAAEDVFRTLATESLSERVHNPGLPADRAPFIVGGCCIVVGVMRRLHLDEVVVSSSNVLDGFAATIAAERNRP